MLPSVSRTLPSSVHLPSGRLVSLALEAPGEARVEDGVHATLGEQARDAGVFAAALHALAHGPVRVTSEAGEAVDVRHLALCDFHALRAICAWAGVLSEPSVEVRCLNCEHAWKVRPAEAMQVAPFVDGELSDPDLDAPFDFAGAHPIPPVQVGGSEQSTVTLADRTVAQAMPFWRALARTELRVTVQVAQAMGVVALGGDTHPGRIARALQRASDEAFDAIADWFDRAHYRARLAAVLRCPVCDARNDLDAPADREFPLAPGGLVREAAGGEPFCDLDAFEAKVRAIAPRAYANKGVGAVDLVVDDAVPHVDDGGEPLLGSYLPPCSPDDPVGPSRPEVRLYYRTFRAMWVDDGPYELEAEIRQTIEHELDHHIAWLAGDDPVDDEEHAEIERERERIVGSRETVRRARARFFGDLADFWRRTWPIWAVLLVATVLAVLAGR
jgi:hypothetical protein